MPSVVILGKKRNFKPAPKKYGKVFEFENQISFEKILLKKYGEINTIVSDSAASHEI